MADTVRLADLKKEMELAFPFGEPEFEKWPEWHDWSHLRKAIKLCELYEATSTEGQ